MPGVVWILAVLFASWAGWFDWRTRRIPNWLTVTGLVIGLGANTLLGGWQGLKVALAGAGLGFALLLPLVLLRGLGAGDWKLIGALGAFLGPRPLLLVLGASIFLTGILALVQVTRERRWRATFGNLWELIRFGFVFGVRPHPEIRLDNPGLLTLPFGVSVAFATLLCFGAGSVFRIS